MQKIFAFIVAAAWFAADYFSKLWALENLRGGTMRLTAWMDFKLAFNKGAAFCLPMAVAGSVGFLWASPF